MLMISLIFSLIIYKSFNCGLIIFTFGQIVDDEISEVETSVKNSEPDAKKEVEGDYPKDDCSTLQAEDSDEIARVCMY